MRLGRRAWLATAGAAVARAAGGAARAAAQGGEVGLGIELAPETVRQGRTVLVRVKVAGAGAAEGLAVSVGLRDTSGAGTPAVRVFRGAGGQGGEEGLFVGLVGIPVDAPLGGWTVTAAAQDPAGGVVATAMAPLEVVDGGFPAQRIAFAGELMSLLEPEVGEEERLTMATVFASSKIGEPLWRGRFGQPVMGRVVTAHGARRDYLDPAGRVVQRSQHGGVDLAAPMGVPIAAPGAGVVAFAGQWSIRGNVVVVDHGAGVHTVHGHASALLVTPGQEVAVGQPLALVGTTGLSTGPHLHWEVRVGGVGVEPLEWTQREELGLG